MFPSLSFLFRFAARTLPPVALAATIVASAPVQAASTLATSTSSGPLTITVGAPTPAVVGQPVQVGFAVTNTSPDPIGPFTMGLQVSPNAKVTSTTTTGVHTCSNAGNGFTCDFLSALQPGLTMNAWNLTIVPQSAGSVTITGFVTPTLGSNAPSNSAVLVIDAVVVAQADLQMTQSASASQVSAGAPVSYTMKLKNAGPNTASSVNVTDVLPLDSVALGAAASNGAPCTISGQTISCALGDLASGSQVTLQLSASAPTITGTVTVTGTVSSPTMDPSASNNTAIASISIR